jgi:hypothetical protein
MERMTLKIFQREVERQCRFAIISVEQIEVGLKNNEDLMWYAIQNLLISVGNISKLFWPTRSRYKDRGEELRRSLGIKDNSPLEPRTFRNHFEHFDERLEKWAKSSERHNFNDANIGPPDMIAGIDVQDSLRIFDPTSWTLFFRGDRYELKSIIVVIYDLYPKVLAEANRPSWE